AALSGYQRIVLPGLDDLLRGAEVHRRAGREGGPAPGLGLLRQPGLAVLLAGLPRPRRGRSRLQGATGDHDPGARRGEHLRAGAHAGRGSRPALSPGGAAGAPFNGHESEVRSIAMRRPMTTALVAAAFACATVTVAAADPLSALFGSIFGQQPMQQAS